jgi:hypothetical protein
MEPGEEPGASGRFLIRLCDLVGAPSQGPLLAVFLPPWPWWALRWTSQYVGRSGEARGSRGGATGGAALIFAPGRAAGAVFFQGDALGDKRLDRAGAACRFWARKN